MLLSRRKCLVTKITRRTNYLVTKITTPLRSLYVTTYSPQHLTRCKPCAAIGMTFDLRHLAVCPCRRAPTPTCTRGAQRDRFDVALLVRSALAHLRRVRTRVRAGHRSAADDIAASEGRVLLPRCPEPR